MQVVRGHAGCCSPPRPHVQAQHMRRTQGTGLAHGRRLLASGLLTWSARAQPPASRRARAASTRPRSPLTGPPLAPSWMRTLTMSMGWMMQVAAMPLRPPFTNGLAVFHTGLSAIPAAAAAAWGWGGVPGARTKGNEGRQAVRLSRRPGAQGRAVASGCGRALACAPRSMAHGAWRLELAGGAKPAATPAKRLTAPCTVH